ncbi:uncharacterized protein LOC124945763 [Impatiens glandulifera]|uniref:uncharacterized protein LOC124945763 n=1 Tax=Impatiens glandulifera TaxID=253017 RepID=UPI001FB196D4|nr:uncharacterized protein LOC124945763 [Impatiens glandulifera]
MSSSSSVRRKCKTICNKLSLLRPIQIVNRAFRSDRVLDALAKASEEKTANIVLYNYPSFSGAFSALFAHLFHHHLRLPCLILPFSSVVPLRVEDLCFDGLQKCYFLDFLGPRGFAAELSRRTSCKVIGFEHRKSALSTASSNDNTMFHVDIEKSSSTAVYEFFLNELSQVQSVDGEAISLIKDGDRSRIEAMLKYIEDVDLRRWTSPDTKSFRIGIGEYRNMLNCITNPHMFDQLLEMNCMDFVAKGNSHDNNRHDAARKLLNKVFKIRLGRGTYGECLATRADGNSELSDEMCKELSIRSAAAGLRPIGAVIYMKRNNNLKMCLRSTDSCADTSEVAKAYGGGGSRRSSSFIIRMDEYNHWTTIGYHPISMEESL